MKRGDVVTLKSGGPQMTVTAVSDEKEEAEKKCKLMYFKTGEIKEASLPCDLLVVVKPAAEPVK